MPNIHELVPSTSKYLKKEDATNPLTVTIASVSTDNVAPEGQPMEIKAVIHFTDQAIKPMVINATNTNIMVAMFSEMTESWISKQVTIYNDPSVQYAGRVVGGLRIRMAIPTQPVPVQTGATATQAATESENPADF
jgi:hypothetical protein